MVPQWYLVLLAVFVAAVLGGVIAWGSSYLQVKAQNFAKKEDFKELERQLRETTRLTEGIKSELSGSLWERQTRLGTKTRLLRTTIDRIGRHWLCSDATHMARGEGERPNVRSRSSGDERTY